MAAPDIKPVLSYLTPTYRLTRQQSRSARSKLHDDWPCFTRVALRIGWPHVICPTYGRHAGRRCRRRRPGAPAAKAAGREGEIQAGQGGLAWCPAKGLPAVGNRVGQHDVCVRRIGGAAVEPSARRRPGHQQAPPPPPRRRRLPRSWQRTCSGAARAAMGPPRRWRASAGWRQPTATGARALWQRAPAACLCRVHEPCCPAARHAAPKTASLPIWPQAGAA